MAALSAVDYKANEVTLPMKMSDAHSHGGRMRVLHDSFVTAGTPAIGDVITFGRLPGQCRVWEATVTTSATNHASGTLALKCGTVAINMGGTAAVTYPSGTRNRSFEYGQTANTVTEAPLVLSDGGLVTLTSATAASAVGVTITVSIKYTID